MPISRRTMMLATAAVAVGAKPSFPEPVYMIQTAMGGYSESHWLKRKVTEARILDQSGNGHHSDWFEISGDRPEYLPPHTAFPRTITPTPGLAGAYAVYGITAHITGAKAYETRERWV